MTSYTILDGNGEVYAQRLPLKEAADTLLTLDGGEYEIRPANGGYTLWVRNFTISNKWRRTEFTSDKPLAAAMEEIFWRVVFQPGGKYEAIPEIL